MSQSSNAYAAAKNNERASAAQRAVADGLHVMSEAIDRQDAAIETMVGMTKRGIADAIATVNAADRRSVDAMSRATEAYVRLEDFTSLTFWQRLNWLITGRLP